MSKATKNTFIKGLVQDMSDQIISADMYDDALNIRLTSDGGNSYYTINNVKGNSALITIPDVPSIITLTPHTEASALASGGVFLPNNGVWSHTPTITTSTGTYVGNVVTSTDDSSYEPFFDAIYTELTTNPVFAPFNFARKGQRIRIWSNTLTVTDYTSAYIQTVVQPQQLDPRIIGWVSVNDIIYLITTNDTSTTGGIGQFFRLTYDNVTFTPQIELIYSDELNLTSLQPIINPGGIEIVYETPTITRMYWTDRMNDLRSVNLSDSDLMAIAPDQMSIAYSATLRRPSLYRTDIGGALINGVYNIGYYLSSGNGARSQYSPLSPDIHITEDSFAVYQTYQGSEGNNVTSKNITVEFSDLDTDYTTLNVIAVRRESEFSQPVISKVAEIAISSSLMRYTYTGSEVAAIIPESTFLLRNNPFNKCHTLTQKDNILFASNTRGETFDIDFDARAYRFDNASQCVLNDVQGNSATYSPATLLTSFGIAEDHDAINPDQSVYRYQSDGVTLGGEGPNISYTFTTQSLIADVTPNINAHPAIQPWRLGNNEINLGDGNTMYEGDFYGSFKSPYMQHAYRSYRREETYRFSIVPVKNGIEGYAKWIADIKMPAVWEQQGTYEFPLMHWDTTNNVWYTNSLGVHFTVNIPQSIADEIDGFRIKRVKLNPSERSIVAQGIIRQTQFSTDTNKYHLIDINGTTVTANSLAPWSTPIGAKLHVFDSPDFNFGVPCAYRAGDSLRFVSGLSSLYQSAVAFYPSHKVLWSKLYAELYIGSQTFAINDARNVRLGENITLATGADIANRTRNNILSGTWDDNYYRSDGTDSVAIHTNTDIPQIIGTYLWPSYIGGSGAFDNTSATRPDKVLMNYVRDTSQYQYGGQGYSARSTNIYIPTGTDVILDGSNTYNLNTFGGDTFINLYDIYAMIKAWKALGGENVSADFMNLEAGNRGLIFMYPIETYVNTELREGVTFISNGYFNIPLSGTSPNYTEPPDPAEFPLDYGEDFKYNYVYSTENELQRSFPVPISGVPNTIHPMRIWASNNKILGERADSWRTFEPDKYIDIQGDLGEIRQSLTVNNRVIVWQKRGFGIAAVNERSVINDANGNGIILGQSGVLPRFDYISRQVGGWNQSAFAVSPQSVLFWDQKNGGIYLFGEGLSDISEGRLRSTIYNATRNGILNGDNPFYSPDIIKGCAFTFDPVNKEFLMTFHTDTDGPPVNGQSQLPRQSGFTIAYNPELNAFTSYMSFKPSFYINDRTRLISSDRNDCRNLFMHDIGDYGVFYDNAPAPSYFRIIVNSDSEFPKVFDNIEWLTEVWDGSTEITDRTYTNLLITTPYQSTGNVSNFTRMLRQWKYAIGYLPNTKERIRAHHCKQRFLFDNADNYKLIAHNIINYYRPFRQ